MEQNANGNECSGSTTSDWEWVKIRRPPQAGGTARAQRGPISPFLPRPRKRSLHLEVKYRGGPQCFWEITCRGHTFRRPGHLAIHDVFAWAQGWASGLPPKDGGPIDQ